RPDPLPLLGIETELLRFIGGQALRIDEDPGVQLWIIFLSLEYHGSVALLEYPFLEIFTHDSHAIMVDFAFVPIIAELRAERLAYLLAMLEAPLATDRVELHELPLSPLVYLLVESIYLLLRHRIALVGIRSFHVAFA